MSCMRMESDGMRYLDGEMSPAERSEFESHLERCETCRHSLERFRELLTMTGRVKMRDHTDEFWEGYWKSIYRRLERKTAWIFVIVGGAMLAGYELYRAVASFGRITFEKVALVIFFIGAALLLISVIRERLHHYKVDRYRDIER